MYAEIEEALIDFYAIRMQKLLKYSGDGRLRCIAVTMMRRLLRGSFCQLFVSVRLWQLASVKFPIGKTWERIKYHRARWDHVIGNALAETMAQLCNRNYLPRSKYDVGG